MPTKKLFFSLCFGLEYFKELFFDSQEKIATNSRCRHALFLLLFCGIRFASTALCAVLACIRHLFVLVVQSCSHKHKAGVMAPFKVGNKSGAVSVLATPLKATPRYQHDEDMAKTVKKSKKKAHHPEVVAQEIIRRPAPNSEPGYATDDDDDFQDRLPVVAKPAKKARVTVADVHEICRDQTIYILGRLEDKLNQLLERNFGPAGVTTAPMDSSAVKAAPKEKKEKLPPVSYALFTKHARPSAVKLIEDSGHKASMGCIRLPKILTTTKAPLQQQGEIMLIPMSLQQGDRQSVGHG